MTKEEITELAHKLATEEALGVIESCCSSMTIYGPHRWLDLSSICKRKAARMRLELLPHRWLDLSSICKGCDDEIRYAEARGLLRHHPTQPNLVQIVEE